MRLLPSQRERRLSVEARFLSLGQRPSFFGLPSGDGSRGAERDSDPSFVHDPYRTRWRYPRRAPLFVIPCGMPGGLHSLHVEAACDDSGELTIP